MQECELSPEGLVCDTEVARRGRGQLPQSRWWVWVEHGKAEDKGPQGGGTSINCPVQSVSRWLASLSTCHPAHRNPQRVARAANGGL